MLLRHLGGPRDERLTSEMNPSIIPLSYTTSRPLAGPTVRVLFLAVWLGVCSFAATPTPFVHPPTHPHTHTHPSLFPRVVVPFPSRAAEEKRSL